MFSALHRDSNPKQFVSFAISLCLQAALLMAVASQRYSPMYGPSLHKERAHAAVTPIYFQRDVPPPAAEAEPEPEPAPAKPAPVLAKEQPVTEEAANTQPDTAGENASGESDGQGLVPFSSWSLKSKPTGFTMMHHEFKNAMPIFAPDPPILHAKKIPEPARGKDFIVEVVINDQGSIVQATVLSGMGYGVENSIMETLRQWIFVPAKVNGYAIASRQQLRFHFPS